MKINLKEILFWIFLAIAIGLLIWYLSGNDSDEFIIIIAILLAVLLKVVSISERLAEMEIKFGFLSKDFKKHIKHK